MSQSSLTALLSGAEQRADNLRRSLRNFDAGRGGATFASVLQQFEQLSKQLVLLQERGADANAEALLEGQFAVPSSVTALQSAAVPGMSTALVPVLLSTMLDKEQEEQAPPADLLALEAEGADSGQPLPSEETIAAHNESLRAAHDHLARVALRYDLPGASNTFAQHTDGAAGRRFEKRQKVQE